MSSSSPLSCFEANKMSNIWTLLLTSMNCEKFCQNMENMGTKYIILNILEIWPNVIILHCFEIFFHDRLFQSKNLAPKYFSHHRYNFGIIFGNPFELFVQYVFDGSMFYRLKPFTPLSQTIKLTSRFMNFHREIYFNAHREIKAILFGQFWCCVRNMILQAGEIWNPALKNMIPVAIFFCDTLGKIEWLWTQWQNKQGVSFLAMLRMMCLVLMAMLMLMLMLMLIIVYRSSSAALFGLSREESLRINEGSHHYYLDSDDYLYRHYFISLRVVVTRNWPSQLLFVFVFGCWCYYRRSLHWLYGHHIAFPCESDSRNMGQPRQ